MEASDTVDRTIRNQRYRWWPAPLMLGGLGIYCPVMTILYDQLEPDLPRPFDGLFALGAFLSFVVLYVVALIVADRVRWIKLGDEFWVSHVRRVPAKDIRAFHFERDPHEDYMESGLPIRLCKLTVELHRRTLRLLISLGDASRVREWAELHGVPVLDPQGYTCRNGL